MFWRCEWPGLVKTCLFIFACVAGSLSSTDVSFISNGKDQRFVFCVILLSCSSIGPTVQCWYCSSRTSYMACPCNKAKMWKWMSCHCVCREPVGLSVFSDDETDLIRELQTMCSSKSEPDISKVLSQIHSQQHNTVCPSDSFYQTSRTTTFICKQTK